MRCFIITLVHWFIPLRGKRILFITSVYSYLADADENSTDLLRRLNKQLNLVRDLDALKLPANPVWRYLFWGNERLANALELAKCSFDCTPETVKGLDDETIKDLCEEMVKAAPEWLRYARREQMRKELFTAITTM